MTDGGYSWQHMLHTTLRAVFAALPNAGSALWPDDLTRMCVQYVTRPALYCLAHARRRDPTGADAKPGAGRGIVGAELADGSDVHVSVPLYRVWLDDLLRCSPSVAPPAKPAPPAKHAPTTVSAVAAPSAANPGGAGVVPWHTFPYRYTPPVRYRDTPCSDGTTQRQRLANAVLGLAVEYAPDPPAGSSAADALPNSPATTPSLPLAVPTGCLCAALMELGIDAFDPTAAQPAVPLGGDSESELELSADPIVSVVALPWCVPRPVAVASTPTSMWAPIAVAGPALPSPWLSLLLVAVDNHLLLWDTVQRAFCLKGVQRRPPDTATGEGPASVRRAPAPSSGVFSPDYAHVRHPSDAASGFALVVQPHTGRVYVLGGEASVCDEHGDWGHPEPVDTAYSADAQALVNALLAGPSTTDLVCACARDPYEPFDDLAPWRACARMDRARTHSAGVARGGGSDDLIVVGGYARPSKAVGDHGRVCSRYDTRRDTWHPFPLLNVARGRGMHVCAIDAADPADGRPRPTGAAPDTLIVCGGVYGAPGKSHDAQVERFDDAAQRWVVLPSSHLISGQSFFAVL